VHLGIETAVPIRYNPTSHSSKTAYQGSRTLGEFFGFLADTGAGLVGAIALVGFLAFAAFVIYRFYKATISTIYVVSELVVFGLFLTPTMSIFAFLGSLLDEALPFSIFTAVGALIGLLVGVYLWLQFH